MIYALESVFLIRLFPVEGSRKGHAYYFEDLAEARFLASNGWDDSFALSHFLLTQIRAEFQYRLGEQATYFQYRTRGGIVPLAIRSSKGVTGVIPIEGNEPSRSERMTARSFLAQYPNSTVIFGHMGREVVAYSPRTLLCPIPWMV